MNTPALLLAVVLVIPLAAAGLLALLEGYRLPSGLNVLADVAVPVDEFDASALADVIKDTEEDVADATDGWQRDKLSHKLSQLKALQAALA